MNTIREVPEDGLRQNNSLTRQTSLGILHGNVNRTLFITLMSVCAVLLGTSIVWYVRTKPIAITGYGVSVEPPSRLHSTTTPEQPTPAPDKTSDTRSWGERLRDTMIPKVPGVVWQTYTNKEYGFEIEYPKDFWIETGRVGDRNTGSYIYFHPHGPPNPNLYGAEHPYATLLAISVSPKSLKEFVGVGSYLDQRFKKGLVTPDATLHGLDIFIENPEGQSDQNPLLLYFEKYSHTYYLVEVHFNEQEDKKMLEHMVKTFHFIKPQ